MACHGQRGAALQPALGAAGSGCGVPRGQHAQRSREGPWKGCDAMACGSRGREVQEHSTRSAQAWSGVLPSTE